MTEHYLKPYGGYSPSPLMFLAAAAAQTKSIRLMTGGIQASFHHPIQLAAEAAQLDAISNGRLELGFARAFLPYEFEAFGIDLDSSKARFQQTIDATVRLLAEESVSETRRSSATATRNRCRARRSSRGRRSGSPRCSRRPASSGSANAASTC